jgi:hypothetical protein
MKEQDDQLRDARQRELELLSDKRKLDAGKAESRTRTGEAS